MADERSRAIFHFEGFRLDLGRARLLDLAGAELVLRHKSFEVLRHLVENPDQIVSRDELLEAVWPGVFVNDDSITQCIAEVRRALGDAGQRLLRTAPKRGYMLAAEVTRAEAPVSPLTTISPDAVAISPPPTPGQEEAQPPALGVVTRAGAERRQVTLLFCDLVGSTALSTRLDPEDLQSVIHDYHRVATTALETQGGYVARFLGDGVLVYFGWPQAGEDDAERAIRAGLAVTEAVSRLEVPQAGPLATRVGIATGPVVVGEMLGKGQAREWGVVGETPNLAARLQNAVGPGMVVVDATTRRLAGAMFEWADLGEVALKGFPIPMRAWRVLGESGAESRFEALRAGHAVPLVGREEELDLLRRRWRQARSGEGRVVLLRGEAGIGKSRLATALQAALAGETREELLLYCSPQHTDSMLRPVISRLERAAEFAVGDAPEVRLAKLEALLTPLAPPAEDMTLIAELLSVPTLGRWPALALSPQARRARLLEALVRRVRALSARQPMLAVVEDAHWLDPTTRELLDLLVAKAPEMTLLLVMTYRPEFDASSWIGMPHVSPVQLNRLGRAEHLELLRRVVGSRALPAEVEEEVLARTDGVPLFVEEVGRAVLESGLLRAEADRWVIDSRLPQLAVPTTLQASLAARLDRLSLMREVAQVGAVIGREFAHDLLAEVSDLPGPALRSALDALTAADLVQRRGEPPHVVYAFRHVLIRDTAHGMLLRERRRALHHRAADAIERLRPEAAEREPEMLAHHRAEAGEVETAIALYLRAGEHAAARAAFREARAHLARGTALLRNLRDATSARRLEAGLLTALGSVVISDAGQGAVEAGEVFSRAVELGCGSGDDALLARATYGLWAYKMFAGDLTGALPLAKEGIALARRQATPDQMPRALAALGMTHFFRGCSDLARPLLEEVLAAPGAYDPGTGFFLSGGVVAQNVLSRLLATKGELEQSVSYARKATDRARQTGHAGSLVRILTAALDVAWLARDPTCARDAAQELTELAEAHGYTHFAVRARCYLGWLAVEEGHFAEGIDLMVEGLAAQRAAGTALMLPQSQAMLADAQLRTGNMAAALEHAEEGLRVSARTGEIWFDAELHRHMGNALLRLDRSGDRTRAESELLRALEIARLQAAKLFELRASRDLAELWRDQGRMAEARDVLAPVYAAFKESFGFPDLIETRALLGKLVGHLPRNVPFSAATLS